MTDAREYAFKTWFIKEVQAKSFATFREVIKEYDSLEAAGKLDNLREKWEALQEPVKPVKINLPRRMHIRTKNTLQASSSTLRAFK